MYAKLFPCAILYQTSLFRCACAQWCYKNNVKRKASGQHNQVNLDTHLLTIYLTHSQDNIWEQRPWIQWCQFSISLVYLVTNKTKVILYNFFKNSMATSNQWRLVLNNVFGGGSLQGTPTFDENQHAIMCAEVCWLLPDIFFPSSSILVLLAAEVPVCCNYPSPEEAVDCR